VKCCKYSFEQNIDKFSDDITHMPERIDFRLVLLNGSKEFENLMKIKEIISIDDYKTLVKSCINTAYEHYYKLLEQAKAKSNEKL
jgi:hypothetical protein